MPKLGRRSPILLDNDNALYSPFGTDNTPILETIIVGGKLRIRPAKIDPAIQPTKPIANIQTRDEESYRKVPKGRYDTTYRREYLNFNGMPITAQPQLNSAEKYLINQNQYTLQNDKSNLNPYVVLPPINNPTGMNNQPVQQQNFQQNSQQANYQQTSIDHIIKESAPQTYAAPPPANETANNDNYLPIVPINLSPVEEQNLMNDVARELGNYSPSQLKSFYSELTSYDPNLTGFVHHTYVTLVSMRNGFPVSEQLMRFVMSRFVTPNKERGHVNYEELVKFIARCQGDSRSYRSPDPPKPSQPQYYNTTNNNLPGIVSPRLAETYDPDEQAILRLMHENMREWDQVNLIDVDSLRKKLYEVDPYNRYILTQREIEDVLYKNRVPIQRSLIYQILEKYCKVATGQYKWPAFVDFLEKTSTLRLTNKKKTHYIIREDEKDLNSQAQLTYRMAQLEALRSKATEEERLDEINKQIYNLQNLKQETKQRIESRLSDMVNGESWFTRFMRLANAMYSHRINAGIDFVMPKDEARQLTASYNTVYDLQIPEQVIENGLNKCTIKGNVIIDDLLKVLSKTK